MSSQGHSLAILGHLKAAKALHDAA